MSSVYTTGDPLNTQNPLKDFFTSISGGFPANLTITIPDTGETVEDSTGELLEVWTAGTPGALVGTATSPAFARGVGVRAVFNTNGLTNNRRVTGSMFLVPLGVGAYDTDGTIAAASLTAFRDAVDDFVAATVGDLSVWTRPVNGAGGKSSGVTSGFVPDKITTLRSRRV